MMSLRELAQAQNKKQAELVGGALSLNDLSLLYNGRRRIVGIDELEQLATRLGVSVGDVAEAIIESRCRYLSGYPERQTRVSEGRALKALKERAK